MKNPNKKGFTLVELLIVIAIIGLLATLAAAAVGYARERAKVAKAQHEIDQINTALNMLTNDSNIWSGHQPVDTVCSGTCERICGDCTYKLSDGYSGLVSDDGATPYNGWRGPYMNAMPVDAWNHEYFFDTDYSTDIDNAPCAGTGVGCVSSVVIGSYGPDGLSNSSGNADDNADDIIKVIYK